MLHYKNLCSEFEDEVFVQTSEGFHQDVQSHSNKEMLSQPQSEVGFLKKSNKSVFSYISLLTWRWWKGVDRYLIISAMILVGLSILLVTTASASVAARVGLSYDYFTVRHLLYVTLSILFTIIGSNLNVTIVKRTIFILFVLNVILLLLTKFLGVENKGARRWINVVGFSLQPSEFIKPIFILLTAFILSEPMCRTKVGKYFIEVLNINNLFVIKNFSWLLNFICYCVVATLLISQPDFGMLITLTSIWAVQLFVAGLNMLWMIVFVCFVFGVVVLSYYAFPHVANRMDKFLNNDQYENYQVSKSLAAFEKGGIFGVGPGEGTVKQFIPDSHTDFIFAVAGEEFGILVCVLMCCIFAFIVARCLLRVRYETDMFIVLATVGLSAQIAIQSIINMSVSLNLLPTKGMTLPFVSYGGSSSLSIAFGFAVLLMLSRQNAQYQTYGKVYL